MKKDDKYFLAGVFFNRESNQGIISSVNGLFPKESLAWLKWIDQGKLLYANTIKLQALLSQQRTDYVVRKEQIFASPQQAVKPPFETDSSKLRISAELLYLESAINIIQKMNSVKQPFTKNLNWYKEYKKKNELFNTFRTKIKNIDLAKLLSDKLFYAVKNNNSNVINQFTQGKFSKDVAVISKNYLEKCCYKKNHNKRHKKSHDDYYRSL